MSYRMAYRLTGLPPKPRDALAYDEGLTDHLLAVSITGTPGGPGALSIAPMVVGPSGAEDLTPQMAFHVAVSLLIVAEQDSTLGAAAARSALAAIRSIVPAMGT